MSYQPHAPAQPQPQVPVRPAAPTTLAHTNAFALVSVILAFIVPIAGVVFGHIAMSQIKRHGDAGRGMALTGLIVGYVAVAMIAFVVVMYISMIAVMIAGLGAAAGGFESYNSSW